MEETPSPQDVDALRKKHEALDASLTPALPPEKQVAPPVKDDWTRETRQALDLSDATVDMWQDIQKDDAQELDKTARLLAQYQLNQQRFLGKLQNLLIEAIDHLEVLEAHWQRLK